MENVLVLDQKKYKIEIVDKAQTRADISFNIILLGDSGVGKSCFSIRAIKDEFIEQIEGTYFISYDIKINNRSMCIQDVCGEDIYKSLVSNYYKNISIAILMYAINDRESFDNIKSWLDDVKHQSRNDVMIILVGNKTDLEEERKVTKEEGEKFKEDNKLDPPYNWIGIGLNVIGKYEDDKWLNDISDKSEWAIAYRGIGANISPENIKKYLLYFIIKDKGLNIAKSSSKSQSLDTRRRKKVEVGDGIYLTPYIQVAEEYTQNIIFNKKKYKILLMAKVKIDKIRQPEGTSFWVLNDEDIRIYRILFKCIE